MGTTVVWNVKRDVGVKSYIEQRGGSVEVCLTRDQGMAGQSLTGVTVLCP